MSEPELQHLDRGSPGYPAPLAAFLGDSSPKRLTLRGDRSLLDRPLLALFCSARLPGAVILEAYDAAKRLGDADHPLIGGFQSPMERECLEVLVRRGQPVIVCPARGIDRMRIPRDWRDAFAGGRLLILSRFGASRRRADTAQADKRNEMVAALASRLLVLHARPASRTLALARRAAGWGKPLFTIDDPANEELLRLGATPVTGRSAREL